MITWRYGCGEYDGSYKSFDLLGTQNTSLEKNVFNLLSEQYSKLIYNKVVVKLYNFVIGWRMEEDCVNEMDYYDTTYLKFRPFQRGRFIQFSNNSCGENNYISIIRQHNASESFSLNDNIDAPRQRIMCRGYKGKMPKGYRINYYPRSTAVIDAGVGSIPIGSTLGACLNKCKPKGGDSFLRVLIGYGPYGGVPFKANQHMATEYEMGFDYSVNVYITYSSRQTGTISA